VVAQVGQAGPGNKAYVAGADDGDVHAYSTLKFTL
jgi:hypothetical protein